MIPRQDRHDVSPSIGSLRKAVKQHNRAPCTCDEVVKGYSIRNRRAASDCDTSTRPTRILSMKNWTANCNRGKECVA